MTGRAILLSVATALLFFPLFFLSAATADDPCSSLTVAYCTTCHNTDRICLAVKENDEQEWKATMKLMGEYGEIGQETIDQMLDCVKKMRRDGSDVCGTGKKK